MLNVKSEDGTLAEPLGFQHMFAVIIKPPTPKIQATLYWLFDWGSRVVGGNKVLKELLLCFSLILSKQILINF